MLYCLAGHLKRLYIYDLVSLDCNFLRFIYISYAPVYRVVFQSFGVMVKRFKIFNLGHSLCYYLNNKMMFKKIAYL
jgi:hypothetical protein